MSGEGPKKRWFEEESYLWKEANPYARTNNGQVCKVDLVTSDELVVQKYTLPDGTRIVDGKARTDTFSPADETVWVSAVVDKVNVIYDAWTSELDTYFLDDPQRDQFLHMVTLLGELKFVYEKDTLFDDDSIYGMQTNMFVKWAVEKFKDACDTGHKVHMNTLLKMMDIIAQYGHLYLEKKIEQEERERTEDILSELGDMQNTQEKDPFKDVKEIAYMKRKKYFEQI